MQSPTNTNATPVLVHSQTIQKTTVKLHVEAVLSNDDHDALVAGLHQLVNTVIGRQRKTSLPHVQLTVTQAISETHDNSPY